MFCLAFRVDKYARVQIRSLVRNYVHKMKTVDYIEELGISVLPHHLRRVVDLLLKGLQDFHEHQDLKTPVRARSTMLLLLDKGPLSITEIASRLGLSHPHIIRKTDDLVQLGLVQQSFDESDHRRRLIGLTPSGLIEAKAISKSLLPIQKMGETLCDEIGIDLFNGALLAKKALEKESCVDRIQKEVIEKCDT